MKHQHVIAVVVMVLCTVISHAQVHRTFSGTVTEKGKGEVVIGASVALYRDTVIVGQKAERGAFTNKYGYYVVRGLEEARYVVVVSYGGYNKFVTTINVAAGDTALTRNIELEQASTEREITVTADRNSVDALSQIGTVTLSPEFVRDMPALGGETDVFRVLQLLPGVKAASEISSGLYVRGGSPDQNLTLLDGVIVYNPAHLGGFLSSFHPDAIRDIKLIKGAFPAEYGGRMSSVLDLTMKEGNKEKIGGTAHLSLIAAGITLDGPIDSNTTFMVSARRFYADLLVALATPADQVAPQYYFYDFNAKVNTKFGENDHLFLSGYFGRDVVGFDETDIESDIGWGNSTANLRWTHIWAPELFSTTSLIYTNYVFGVDLANSQNSLDRFGTKSDIQDYTFRTEFQYAAADVHNIKAGIDITHHDFVASVSSELDEFDNEHFNPKSYQGLDAALFIQDEWSVTDDWKANIGGRLYYFQQGNYLRVEPRFSTAFNITSTSAITASAAVAHQFLHLITRNDISLPTDVWFPSTSVIKPSSCWQTVLGYQKSFLDNEYRFTVETYYKWMDNLYEYRDDAEFTLGVPLENQFTSGTGRAYGVEFFLQKQVGDFTGWIGYTLSWTHRLFAELNDGREFYPRYDRRHDIQLALQYRLGKSWRFGTSFVYSTGAAYTMPQGQYIIGQSSNDGGYTNQYNYYTERNGWRAPSFHKLDVNFIHEFTMYGLPWEISFNVYNVYNRANPFAVYVTSQYDEASGNSRRVVKQLTLFPIIPTLGLRVTF